VNLGIDIGLDREQPKYWIMSPRKTRQKETSAGHLLWPYISWQVFV